jgi:hypothetical protein
MSDQAATLPTPEAGFNHLMENIHGEVFFNKLAAAGFAPQNEAQMRSQIELAGKLRHLNNSPQVKQAEAAQDPYAKANSSLDRVMAHRGLDGGVKQAEAQQDELAIGQAAAHLMQDPGLYNSVLAVKAAEARDAASYLGLDTPPAEQPAG